MALMEKLSKPDVLGRIRKKVFRGLDHFERGRLGYGLQYLNAFGWERSAKEQRPVNVSGDPVPWITYPAFRMLESVVQPHHRVFEYGCGNSSLWWAKRVQWIISVEHNGQWSRCISAQAPDNLKVILRTKLEQDAPCDLVDQFFARKPDLPGTGNPAQDQDHLVCKGYSSYVMEAIEHQPFDIIIVDGAARSLSAWIAGHCLTEDGFIVFDNSDRWQYNAGYEALRDLGFGRVDFWGPGPALPYTWCTSIFFRTPKWSEPAMLIKNTVKSDI